MNSRLVTIYGEQEIGKSNFIKMAGKYLFERHKFVDGVYYIDNKENLSEILLINKFSSYLNLQESCCDIINSSNSSSGFFDLIKDLRVLFLLNFNEQEKENITEFKNFIKKIIDNT